MARGKPHLSILVAMAGLIVISRITRAQHPSVCVNLYNVKAEPQISEISVAKPQPSVPRPKPATKSISNKAFTTQVDATMIDGVFVSPTARCSALPML